MAVKTRKQKKVAVFNSNSVAFQNQHFFGDVRLQASAIWRGPCNIVIKDRRGVYFYGWPMLSLEARAYRTDRIESRSIYANLSRKSQRVVILRAVSWNGKAVREAIRPQGKNPQFDLVMPAKYVSLPVKHFRAWLSEFDGVSVLANETCEDYDDLTVIRRLRIDRDYMNCVFEKVWQFQEATNVLMNHKWEKVWEQMTKALVTKPLITNFDEDFWFVNPEVKYDFEAYQANWFALE